MSITVTITCNTPGCEAAYTVQDSTVGPARTQARLDGWGSVRIWQQKAPRYTNQDQCPAHATATPRHRTPNPPPCGTTPEQCPRGGMHHLLGHDALGSRTANILGREGITTREQLAVTPEPDLLDMRGLGQNALRRIRHVLGVHP